VGGRESIDGCWYSEGCEGTCLGTPWGGARDGYEKFAREGLLGVTGLTVSFMGFGCSIAGETEDSSTLWRMLLFSGIGGDPLGGCVS
jgi:hypothetical protein